MCISQLSSVGIFIFLMVLKKHHLLLCKHTNPFEVLCEPLFTRLAGQCFLLGRITYQKTSFL